MKREDQQDPEMQKVHPITTNQEKCLRDKLLLRDQPPAVPELREPEVQVQPEGLQEWVSQKILKVHQVLLQQVPQEEIKLPLAQADLKKVILKMERICFQILE